MSGLPAGVERVRPFVTDTESPVYCLRNLPEEVVAVLFAYYSRSRETLRENLLKLIQDGDIDTASSTEFAGEEARLAEARDRARAFHEKWVVGYGHSSVAEHAMVHVAVEDVSILVSKVIEDARLASFTEKSTRYVPFDTSRFITPDVFRSGPGQAVYAEAIAVLMDTYSRLMEPLTEHFLAVHPVREGQTERGRMTSCKAQACDVLRYLLPAATLTNIGMTVNARALEGLLVKMLSHPLEEARRYGGRIKDEARKIVPTLIKYADRSEFRAETERDMEREAGSLWPGSPGAGQRTTPPDSRVRLVRYDEDGADRVLTALLFSVTNRSAAEVEAKVAGMGRAEASRILNGYVARRGRHDQPLRAFEETRYLFEVTVDYGAYRDIQRHRMAGQYPQRLTADLGCERPEGIDDAGMGADFDRAMDSAAEAWRILAVDHPEEAQYVLPLGFRKRFLMSMNLRELHHFISLRSARQGHTSYRRVAQDMYQEVLRVHPELASAIRVDLSDYVLSRE